MGRILKTTAGLLAAAAGLWFYLTPHLAAREMWSAVEARDSARLARHVDFPALKQSVKAQFSERIAPAPGSDGTGASPLRAFGSALAGALVNPLVEALLTPEGLAVVMRGNRPGTLGSGRSGKEPQVPDPGADTESAMGYEGFDRFVIRVKKKGSADEPIGFVLHREGLIRWKLAGLRLPA